MKEKLSKTEAKKEIEKFFENTRNKSSKEIKKIKKLAQSRNLKIKDKRKLFCKKCLTPFLGKENLVRYSL